MSVFKRFGRPEKKTLESLIQGDAPVKMEDLLGLDELQCRPDIIAAAVKLLHSKKHAHDGYDILGPIAAEGDAEAQFLMGEICEDLLDRPQQAASWFRRSAEQGHHKAQRSYADMLITGKGVTQDHQKAASYYQMAAQGGIPEAQFVLGESYRTGMLLQQDHSQALQWYRRAADSGYAPAASRIEQFYPDRQSTASELHRRQTSAHVTSDASNAHTSGTFRAMQAQANKEGWLVDGLSCIPELMNIFTNASTHFTKLVFESGPHLQERLVYRICRYLFAKGVEGVVLWGPTPDGKVSVYFHPTHFTQKFETEVPKHLHHIVEESMAVGERLFRAHEAWVIQEQQHNRAVDVAAEITELLKWAPVFGISYALQQKYQDLR